MRKERDQVFDYLKTKYKNGVAHIITFGKLKARMVLRDVGRVLGLSYGHVDEFVNGSIRSIQAFNTSRVH